MLLAHRAYIDRAGQRQNSNARCGHPHDRLDTDTIQPAVSTQNRVCGPGPGQRYALRTGQRRCVTPTPAITLGFAQNGRRAVEMVEESNVGGGTHVTGSPDADLGRRHVGSSLRSEHDE